MVNFAQILAPAGRSFVEQIKKVTLNNQKCYSKMLTTLLKYATIWVQKQKRSVKNATNQRHKMDANKIQNAMLSEK